MKKKVILFWMIFSTLACLRVFQSMHTIAPDMGSCLKQPVIGQGIVSADPSNTDAGQVLVVDTTNIELDLQKLKKQELSSLDLDCSSAISVRIKTKLYPKFQYGDLVNFSGNISAPFNFKSGTGRTFDYQGYLAKDDIFYEIKSGAVILSSDQAPGGRGIYDFGDSLTSILYKIKRGFVNNLNMVLGEPHSALAAGLVVGEKSALGKDLLNDFRTVGLIHIVVLSGFNITVVADAMRRLLSRLPRVWGIVIGGIGMVLFCILVGGGATVIRSCFMASIGLIGNLIRRDYNVTRALIFAGLLMLIQNPTILLHDPSFQLSFLATLGLILLASPIERLLWFIPERFEMRGIFAATISTQIFVSPFILYMMGQLSLIGVFANVLVLPFIPVTMLAVFLTGASGFLSPFISIYVSQFFGWIAHLLLNYELLIVENFVKIPFASVTFPQFSFWWVVGFYVVFAVGYISLRFYLNDKSFWKIGELI